MGLVDTPSPPLVTVVICHHVRDQVLVVGALERSASVLLEVLQVVLAVVLILTVEHYILNPVMIGVPIKLRVSTILETEIDLSFVEQKIVMHNDVTNEVALLLRQL